MGKISIFLLSAIMSAGVFAQDKPNVGKITNLSPLPVEKLIYFDTENGERGIMAENGRYVIMGDFKLVDTWAQKEVKNIDDVKEMELTPTSKLKEVLHDTAHFTFGHGDTEIFVFTDLSSEFNSELYAQFNEKLLSKYKIQMVYFPALKNAMSFKINKSFMCSKNQDKAKEALSKFSSNKKVLLEKLQDIGFKEPCELTKLGNSEMLSKTSGIKRIPTVINAQGKSEVAPKKLEGFLND